jgi:hypothetical protein
MEHHPQLTIFCGPRNKDFTLLFEFFNRLWCFFPRVFECSYGKTTTLTGMPLNLSKKSRLRADIIVVLKVQALLSTCRSLPSRWRTLYEYKSVLGSYATRSWCLNFSSRPESVVSGVFVTIAISSSRMGFGVLCPTPWFQKGQTSNRVDTIQTLRWATAYTSCVFTLFPVPVSAGCEYTTSEARTLRPFIWQRWKMKRTLLWFFLLLLFPGFLTWGVSRWLGSGWLRSGRLRSRWLRWRRVRVPRGVVLAS